MIPIGSKQKPLLEYIIRILKYHGIYNLVLLVGYKHEQIINYFEDGKRFGINIKYIHDKEGYKGNGWALLNAYEQNAFNDFENILVYYGDIISIKKENKFAHSLNICISFPSLGQHVRIYGMF